MTTLDDAMLELENEARELESYSPKRCDWDLSLYKLVPSDDGLPSSGEGGGGEPPEGEDGLSGREAGGVAPEDGGGLSGDVEEGAGGEGD